MTEFNINIDRLAFGGSGVGRVDGKVCFVPYSCPGDELQVREVSQKRSYSTASICNIVKPSVDRVLPVCSLFGKCGGCNWQHVEYAQQLAAKRAIFADTLWRGARIDGNLVEDVIPSSRIYGYRSRVQFKLHVSNGRIQIGFYRQGTHVVEDAPEGCPIALPLINQVLATLRNLLQTFPEPQMLSQINIDSAEQGAIAVINYIGQNVDAAAAFFSKSSEQLLPLTGVYLKTGKKNVLRKVYGDDLLTYALPDRHGSPCWLSFRPGGFSQVNQLQNHTLLELVRRLSAFCGDERVLDLYCGNGNFSLPLAGEVADMTGIEDYAGSVATAVDNARKNNIKNAVFTSAEAVAAVRKLADDGARFDVVILDPPRCGAGEAVADIIRLKPDKIIYISCDPSTLARDCSVLIKDGAYQVKTCIPVDMFPQTYHLESVTMLQRNFANTACDRKMIEKAI